MLIVITVVICGLGGGGFYLLYLRSRPKKESWTALVYQVSTGIQPEIKNKRGEVISDLRLQDLKAYGKDIVTKNFMKNGRIVYKLEHRNLAVGTINEGDEKKV